MDVEEYVENNPNGNGNMEEDEYYDDSYDSDQYDYYMTCKKCRDDRSYDYVATLKPIVYSDNPCKLTEISTITVAVNLWNHLNVTHAVSSVTEKCTKDRPQWEKLCNAVHELINELSLPKSVADEIKNHVKKLAYEITNWVSYHFRTVLLKKGQDNELYSLIHHIVWHQSGVIDCKQTARNLLSSFRLSEVEKFKFLATYCLKEEIQGLSPLLFANNVLEFVSFSEYPLIYYWYCFVRNELHKIPVIENRSINSVMFRHAFVDNWTAKKYFFDLMSSEEQVQHAIWLIDSYGLMYQKLILMNLSETQRLHVYMERSVKIMMLYAKSAANVTDLVHTWFNIRNLITADRYVEIFDELLKASTVDTIMTLIWNTSSNDFKYHLMRYDDHKIVNQVLHLWKWAKDSELIFIMLQDSDVDTKKSITKNAFFTRYCQKTLACDEISKFDRLLQLCLPKDFEAAQFKQDLANTDAIKSCCLKYYESGNTKGLNKMLNLLFSSNSDHILEYKKMVLVSKDGIGICASILCSNVETDKLNSFITDSSLSTDTATLFKKQIMISNLALSKFNNLILKRELSNVQKCIDRYLASDEDRKLFKKKLKNPDAIMRDILIRHDESYWQTVILWYYEDEKLVQQFKVKLPLDSIFDKMLIEAVFERYYADDLRSCKLKHAFNFNGLDRFLNWYFESPSEVKKYKMRRMNKFKGVEVISVLLRKSDASYIKSVLKWFFQNDADEIVKFKIAHPVNKKICSLI